MIETTSVLPGLVILENLRTFPETIWKRLSDLRTFFGESSKIFGKCSEVFGKSSKMSSLVCFYNKQNNTWLLVDLVFSLICAHSWDIKFNTRINCSSKEAMNPLCMDHDPSDLESLILHRIKLICYVCNRCLLSLSPWIEMAEKQQFLG